jgi:hypothetical protein
VLRTFVVTSEEDGRWNFRHRNSEFFLIGPPPKSSIPTVVPNKDGEDADR